MLGLHKANRNKKYRNFKWDLTVGAVNTAPDWNPLSKYGGLHVLPNAQGSSYLLDASGDYWIVVEFDESDLVVINKKVAKVKQCKIVHVTENPNELLGYFKDVAFDNRSAYNWAKHIGDEAYMKQFITESKYAFWWALYIGDKEYMKQFVNPESAFLLDFV
jgi:hypothetical protein